MKILSLLGVAVLAAMTGIASAEAAPGYVTANVNLRTGPDTDFPPVGVIPESAPVNVQGCLRDESWCDVVWDGSHGWIFSEYLAMDYRGEMRPLPDIGVEAFRIPLVTFAASDYWGRYYVGRPWYAERDRWFAFKVRPREGWRAPPVGPRPVGWWHTGGYHAPPGMRLPPERGWKPHPMGRPGDHDHHDHDRDHDHRP